MSECSITLHVDEPQPITLDYIEAKIKPEVVGHATPTEQAQTVTPAPGTTFSAVEVDAIPPEYVVPSGTLDITENAEDINVRDKAAVRVNVQPNLQTPEPITPTEQQQTITPGARYDGLAQAVVEPIPSEYIVPAGKITLTENATDVDVSQYEKADVSIPSFFGGKIVKYNSFITTIETDMNTRVDLLMNALNNLLPESGGVNTFVAMGFDTLSDERTDNQILAFYSGYNKGLRNTTIKWENGEYSLKNTQTHMTTGIVPAGTKVEIVYAKYLQ